MLSELATIDLGLPLCFLFFSLFPMLGLIDSPSTRVKTICISSTVILAMTSLSILAFPFTERGRWEAVKVAPTASHIVEFLIDHPNSHYENDARRLLTRAQEARLSSTESHIANALLELVLVRPGSPGQIAVLVTGVREYVADNRGEADTDRYDKGLLRFEKFVLSEVNELATSVGGGAYKIQSLEDHNGPVFKVNYLAKWGPQYTKITDRIYSFNSINLSATWELVINNVAQFSGQTKRYAPGRKPQWVGSKFPEEAVFDDVAQDLLTELAELLEVSAPDLGAIRW